MSLTARTTLKDIAARSGVTFQTVSAVLTNKPGARVSASKRLEIRILADQLGYRPHAGARALIRKRWNALVLVQTWRGHPLDHLIDGVLDAAGRHGQRLIIARFDDQALADPKRLPLILAEHHADGLLINCNVGVPVTLPGLLNRHQLPAIWLNGDQPVDGIRPDDRDGARLAVHRLIELGHRRIAWCPAHASQHCSESERLAGYTSAMIAAGLRAQTIAPENRPWMDGPAWDHLAQLWACDAERPTAVLCSRPGDAQTGRLSLARAGLSVPDAISLVAFAPEPIEPWGHGIATVLVPDRALGDAAVALLVGRIERAGRSMPTRTLPCEFVPGSSLGRAP